MQRRTVLRALVAASLALFSVQPASAGSLKAGASRVEITPPEGTPLSGYAARKGAPSTGVHDPLHARALVLDDGATQLAIVTVDLIGTDPVLTRRVARQSGFPAERLMICSSHTHSGPGAFSQSPFAVIAGGAYKKDVQELLITSMADAIKKAVANLQPARIGMGETELKGFQRNRRGSPQVDPSLWVLRVDRADGAPLALLANLTAHGTVLEDENLEFSADWMGFFCARLEAELPGSVALYANGAEGDISPNIPAGTSGFEAAKAHGELGAQAALTLARSLEMRGETTLAFRTAPLETPNTLKAALLGASKKITLQTFTIDQSVLISVPGELTTALGLVLKEHGRRQGFRHAVIMGLANDHLGYILTRAEMKKGGYEAGVSFFGDDFGETLIRALGGLLGGDLAPLEEALKRASQP